jgi:hypothetical protein
MATVFERTDSAAAKSSAFIAPARAGRQARWDPNGGKGGVAR